MKTAAQERDAAMAGVLAAEKEANAEWLRRYYAFVELRAPRAPGPFTGEDVRRAWTAMGLPQPHHHNVWGAAFNGAVRRGLVVATGDYDHMCGVRSHARKTPLYKAAA